MAARTIIAMMLLAAVGMAGCDGPAATEPGSRRVLGQLPYDDAFVTAQAVFSRYFEVASADQDAGVIHGRPKMMPGGASGILSSGQAARQVSTLKLRRDGTQIVAFVAVEVQRTSSAGMRSAAGSDDAYSSVPDQPYANRGGDISPEQDQDWQTYRYATDVQSRMMEELADAMRPLAVPTTVPATTAPASLPAAPQN